MDNSQLEKRLDQLDSLVTQLAASIPVEYDHSRQFSAIDDKLNQHEDLARNTAGALSTLSKMCFKLVSKSEQSELETGRLLLASHTKTLDDVNSTVAEHQQQAKHQVSLRLDSIASDVANTKQVAAQSFQNSRALLLNTFDLFGV